MMTYPNSYALLSEEELEYTTGGALDAETVGNWISTAMNVTMGVLAIVNVVNALSLIHISEPTRRTPISYAVFCLKKKKKMN